MAREEAADRRGVDIAPEERDPHINYENVLARVDELISRNPEGVTESATGPFKLDGSEGGPDDIGIEGGAQYWHRKRNVTVNGILVASRTDYEAIDSDSPDKPKGQKVSSLSLYGVFQANSLEIHVDTSNSQGGLSHSIRLSQPGANDKLLKFWGADVKASIAKKFGLTPAIVRR